MQMCNSCMQSLNEGKQIWLLVFVILVLWHLCSLCKLKLIALTWYFVQLRFISLGDFPPKVSENLICQEPQAACNEQQFCNKAHPYC